jgi:phage terminase large subunit-like protein
MACPRSRVAQTMASLTSASKELEKLVLAGRLHHDGNPVMRWCVSNVVAASDANGNLRPHKQRSHERIDGVSALVTALAHPTPGSVYDVRGVELVEL